MRAIYACQNFTQEKLFLIVNFQNLTMQIQSGALAFLRKLEEKELARKEKH